MKTIRDWPTYIKENEEWEVIDCWIYMEISWEECEMSTFKWSMRDKESNKRTKQVEKRSKDL